ncbi:M23 family metallopeptidase [Acidipropionibacterium acidipropionici]|uniref:M23 family metallopeptidase n=1 Tax=Acidipropionibacterium acidipropionici TaxID=1748 RepID=UPI001F1D7EE5|nr:M23 family metallopeptidase [Acidipropionibacterium acidipropionici]
MAKPPHQRRTEAARRYRLRRPDGTAILAAADGVVTVSNYSQSGGGIIVIEHTIRGEKVATAYIHMWHDGIHVAVGDTVTAGQHIGDVGQRAEHRPAPALRGPSRRHERRSHRPPAWLNDHDAADLPASDTPNTQAPVAAKPAQVRATGPTRSAGPGSDGRGSDQCRADHRPHAPPLPTSLRHVPGHLLGLLLTRPGTPASTRSGELVTSPSATRSAGGPHRAARSRLGGDELKKDAETLASNTSSGRDRSGPWPAPMKAGALQRRRHARPSDVTGGHYDHLHVTVQEG